MKKYILILMLLPTLAFAEKIVVDVPGMVCQMCVQGMQKTLLGNSYDLCHRFIFLLCDTLSLSKGD